MDKLIVRDTFELADTIYEKAKSKSSVTAVLFYDEAIALFRDLIDYEDVSIRYIDIAEEDINGYGKEYYVTMDDDLSIYIEKAISGSSEGNTKYKHFETDYLYIDGSASYAIVKSQDNSSCKTYELIFSEYECEYRSDENFDDADNTDNSLFKRVLDVLEYLFSPEYDDVEPEDEVTKFVNKRFPNDSNWRTENCYYFALILKDRFPGGDIVYDVIDGHFSYRYKGAYYDHTGKIEPEGYIVKWDDFDEYDSIQKSRIIRDCIM